MESRKQYAEWLFHKSEIDLKWGFFDLVKLDLLTLRRFRIFFKYYLCI